MHSKSKKNWSQTIIQKNSNQEMIYWLRFLLVQTVPKKQNELIASHKRVTKHKAYIFNFSHLMKFHPTTKVLKSIRNVKIKQKISGHYKTENWAQIFAIIRSLTDTCKKNGKKILVAFKTNATLEAEFLQKLYHFFIFFKVWYSSFFPRKLIGMRNYFWTEMFIKCCGYRIIQCL